MLITQSNIRHNYQIFTLFMIAIFPGLTPAPPQSWTEILELSHDPIRTIWLSEVSKLHQHYERMTFFSHSFKCESLFSLRKNCKIILGEWNRYYGRTRFRDIWVYDKYRMYTRYCIIDSDQSFRDYSYRPVCLEKGLTTQLSVLTEWDFKRF